MSNTFTSPLRPKPGARAARVTPPPARARQSVTNAQWREQRAAAHRRGPLRRLIGKLLGEGRADG